MSKESVICVEYINLSLFQRTVALGRAENSGADVQIKLLFLESVQYTHVYL